MLWSAVYCLICSDKMVMLGYNKSDIVRAVEENQCNEMMATYSLLHQQLVVSAFSLVMESKELQRLLINSVKTSNVLTHF